MRIKFAGIAALIFAIAGIAHAQQPAAAPPAPAAQPAPVQKVTGLSAWAMVVGNTVTAKIDGKDHAEYYMADGSVKAMEGGALSKGRWALEGLKVCFMYPKEPKRCYAIEAEDKIATFTGADGSFRGEISKGNAKNL